MTSKAANWATWLSCLALVVLALVLAASKRAEAAAPPTPPSPAPYTDGESLYLARCASCHGADGSGVPRLGPDIREEGEAAADYVLRTGRMPMAHPNEEAERNRPFFSDTEIRALVAYVGGMGNGPRLSPVNPAAGDLANGGYLYRLNCAACHVASGSGAPIGGGRRAPALAPVTPDQVGQAIRVGPGAMPAFATFTDGEINDVAAYVQHLQQERSNGVRGFGGAGPVAEGLAAWMLCLLPLIAVTRWLGTPHDGRDEPLEDDPADRQYFVDVDGTGDGHTAAASGTSDLPVAVDETNARNEVDR